MRGTWKTVIALGGALALAAAAGAQQRPEANDISAADAIKYATQVYEVAKIVENQYIRPVTAPSLVAAALKGLYKAAQKPAPADLAERIAEAVKKDKAAQKPASADLGERIPRPARKDHELVKLIALMRMELGNDDNLRNSKAINASLQALVETLDPYCALILDRNVSSLRVPSVPFGPGMELVGGSVDCPVVVKKVTLGSPAQRAGLRPGDQIIELNHQPARNNPLGLNVWNQSGQAPIAYRREGDSRLRHGFLKAETLHPETVLGVSRLADNSWDYWLDAQHRIAQIRLGNLEHETVSDLNQVLAHLQAEHVAGLILDLRWCPGGYLIESRTIADIFVGEYNLAYFVLPTPNDFAAQADPYLDNHCENAAVRYRDGRLDSRARTPGAGFPLVPMVVLVNGESSGGAELIAAVLQDNHRARIMGQRTKGKASVQELIGLLDDPSWMLSYRIEAKIKISDGLIVRPSGKNLNRFPDSRLQDAWGVQPDRGLEYRISPELTRQLATWWQWQDLRPGDSNESLPLDHPAADPQRQAALRLLLQNLH